MSIASQKMLIYFLDELNISLISNMFQIVLPYFIIAKIVKLDKSTFIHLSLMYILGNRMEILYFQIDSVLMRVNSKWKPLILKI